MTYKPRTREDIHEAQLRINLPITRDYPAKPLTQDQIRLAASDLIDAIRRHCDLERDHVLHCWVNWDDVCVHCGYAPDTSDNGFPWCCDEAQSEARAAGVEDPEIPGGAS